MKMLNNVFKRGISLRKLNICMFLVAVLISLVLFFSMRQTSEIYRNTHETTQNLISWRMSAYDLQLASDYLTEEIRSFAVTGDLKYLQRYFEEAKVTRRRDRALEDLALNHEDTEAYDSLNGAMAESMNLMNREFYAARLTAEAYGHNIGTMPEEIRRVELTPEDQALTDSEKKQAATALLFDNEYHAQKEAIFSHMQSCLAALEVELANKQRASAVNLEHQVAMEHLLTVLLIGIMLGIVFLTARLVIFPLQRCVGMIRDEKDIPLDGAYEVRFLAKTYNLMHHTNQQSQEKLTYEATHDKLTGLYNRRGYDFLLENVDLETSALLLFDLDKFKQVNDSFGHDAGDRVLMKVADALFCSFRTQDFVCRIGGDEFAVIMVHADPSLQELIRTKGRKINERLREETPGTPAISVSMGVAFGYEGMDAESLFKRADTSLYKAKENDETRVWFFSGAG